MAEGQQLLAPNMASKCAICPFFPNSLQPTYLANYIKRINETV
jgi:hypothetical protein